MHERSNGPEFDRGSDALVNRINCRGVMGNGIAKMVDRRSRAPVREHRIASTGRCEATAHRYSGASSSIQR